MEPFDKAASRCIEHLELSPEVDQALRGFVSLPSGVRSPAEVAVALSERGPGIVRPMLIAAPFVRGDVRDYVLRVVEGIGDWSTEAVILLLDEPLLHRYESAWHWKNGLKFATIEREAWRCCSYVYPLALEALHRLRWGLEADLNGASAAWNTARAYSTPPRDAPADWDHSRLSSLATDITAVAAAALGLDTRPLALFSQGGRSFESTGLGQSMTDYMRRSRMRAQAQAAEQARIEAGQAMAADMWFTQRRRQKDATGTGCVLSIVVSLFALGLTVIAAYTLNGGSI